MADCNMLQDFGNGLELRKNLEIELFLPSGDIFRWHLKPMFLIERGDDPGYRHTSPGIEETFTELAIPFREGLTPCYVVERHGIGNGAVAVEQVGGKRPRREF